MYFTATKIISISLLNFISFLPYTQAMNTDNKKQETTENDRQALQEHANIKAIEKIIFKPRILTPEEMEKGKHYKSITKKFSEEERAKIKAVEEIIFKPIEVTFNHDNNTTTQ